MRKPTRKLSKNQEKICNKCGEMTLVYTVVNNAPLCVVCVPITTELKKILNEQQMLNEILGK